MARYADAVASQAFNPKNPYTPSSPKARNRNRQTLGAQSVNPYPKAETANPAAEGLNAQIVNRNTHPQRLRQKPK